MAEPTLTVEEVRIQVFVRDEGCMAPRIDPKAGPCYDRWGEPLPRKMGFALVWPWDEMEMDYCRYRSHDDRHKDPEDDTMQCPGHHQGAGPSAGKQWATSHRQDIRAYLDRQEGIVRLGDGTISIDGGDPIPARDMTLRQKP